VPLEMTKEKYHQPRTKLWAGTLTPPQDSASTTIQTMRSNQRTARQISNNKIKEHERMVKKTKTKQEHTKYLILPKNCD